MTAPDGMVVGIYGAWGLGKTTVLNFVEHYLNEDAGDAFVVIRFNPWWFSGRTDLAVAFFDELRQVFAKWDALGDAARKQLARFAKAIGAVPGFGVASAAGELIDTGLPDVRELKDQLSAALRKQDTRLLIVIDDIDRLNEEEVAELFSVVKALADFPNTVYLLAFDLNRVAEALEGRSPESGREYVEKIVQVPFELPRPEREDLQAVLVEHLVDIVGEVDDDLLVAGDWTRILTMGIMPMIITPRDVVRLTNSLRVTYGAVADEVNVIDFIALETLRLVERKVYDSIRLNPAMFGATETGIDAMLGVDVEERRRFHREWFAEVPEQRKKAVRELVIRLFPRVGDALESRSLGFGRSGDARKERRISDPDVYPAYFRFGIGDRLIPRSTVAELLERAGDADAFGQALVALAPERLANGQTRAGVMLDEIIAQVDRIPLENAEGPVCALIDIGDKLWTDSGDPIGLRPDNATRMTTIIGELLQRMQATDRQALLERAITESQSASVPALVVRRLEGPLGVPADKAVSDVVVDPERADLDALVTAEGAKRLEELAAGRIAAAAEEGTLAGAPRLQLVLAHWRLWSDVEAVRSWVTNVRRDNEQFAQLLLSFRSAIISQHGTRIRLNPNHLGDYVDSIEALSADVEMLRGVTDDEDVHAACEQYLREYEIIKAGRDPELELR